jgi:phage terminase Nu1 subunit (DNA packaging protein)
MDEQGYSKRDFAYMFGVSLASVDKWVEQGIPRIAVGKQRWRYGKEAIKWVYERTRKKNGKRPNLNDEKAAVELEMAKIKLERERGASASVTLIDEVLGDIAKRLDSKVTAFPRKWAPELLGIEDLPKMVEELDRGVEELRAELRVAADD